MHPVTITAADGHAAPRQSSQNWGAATARAMAFGVLRDGSPVIADGDGSVREWRLADGTPLVHPLDLPEPSWVVALRGNIITAGGRDIGIHQPGAP